MASTNKLLLLVRALPAELRSKIWQELPLLAAVPITNRGNQCKLDLDSGEVSRIPLDETKIIPVGDSGDNTLFRLMATIVRGGGFPYKLFHEATRSVIFSFKSSNALANFVNTINKFYDKTDYEVPLLRITIHFFSPDNMPNRVHHANLCSWTPQLPMAHGYTENALGHVRAWMDAVQKLNVDTEVEVCVHRPWMDYRSLRGLTAPLRANGKSPRVRVAEGRWGLIPDPSFHIGVTIASLQGTKMARQSQITLEEAKILADHGCRGFRG